MKYRIGLDLGIGSVGWAVLEDNQKGEPFRIVDLGSRVFDAAENPKDGSPLAEPRREARGTRRRLRRRKHRINRTKKLLEKEDIITQKEIEDMYEKGGFTHSVYELRVLGLEGKLNNRELARVLIHFMKKRGYKSNSKSEEVSNKEAGKLLTATRENMEIMEKNGYKSIAEMYLKDNKFKITMPDGEEKVKIKNSTDDYKATVLRSMLKNEIENILDKQKELNEKVTDNFITKYLEIFESQRNFDEGPGYPSEYGGDLIEKMLGNCTFEKQEKRAAKATYTFEYFKLLQDLNHIKIDAEDGKRVLSNEERNLLINLAKKKATLTMYDLRKELKLKDEKSFNLVNYKWIEGKTEIEQKIEAEKSQKLKEFESYHKIRKALDKIEKNYIEKISIDDLDQIGYALTVYKNDEKRIKYLQENTDLEQEAIDRLIELTFRKVGNLSLKAMKKIIPYLEEGNTYDKAVNSVYEDFRGRINYKKVTKLSLNHLEQEISNPVVRRTVSQTIKVVNAIVNKYGKPDVVVIELARELSKNFSDRNKIKKEQDENKSHNEKVKLKIEEYGKFNPTGKDIVKMKLWEEQDGVCMYSGRKISITDLFTEAVDVDHIIPYSICFDDSYNNKVLVLASENRQKGNRIPYQYMEQTNKNLEEYEQRIIHYIKNNKKKQKLLKKSITREEMSDWKERNIKDTQYITKLVYNLIKNNLEFEKTEGIVRTVYAVNGKITDHVRKRLGINKIREDGDTHHAMDAVVIATISQNMINKITRYYQYEEGWAEYNNGEYIDLITGEVMKKDDYEKQYGIYFPAPWDKFRKELDIRMMENKDRIIECLQSEGFTTYENFDDVKPIFVSRMPRRKVRGQAHQETLRGLRKENGIIRTVTKTELTKLKLGKGGEIEGYPKKNIQDDRLLYNALKERLVQFQNNAKKAFKEPFYKPKADGTPGPIVKKVQLEDKPTLAVELNDDKSMAANGDMVRIDVYKVENDGYYFVPIYVSDTIKNKLPMRACVGAKPYSKWKEMREEDFIFSVYPGDLIKVIKHTGITLNPNKNKELKENTCNEVFVYFVKAGISTASITVTSQDRKYIKESLGIKNLDLIEKYDVDILGNYHKVKLPEKHLKFSIGKEEA